jgi:hypothetical protein
MMSQLDAYSFHLNTSSLHQSRDFKRKRTDVRFLLSASARWVKAERTLKIE